MTTQLVLFAHGSKDPRWRAPFLELLAALRAEMGDQAVSLAFMEFAEPGLLEVARLAAAAGFTRLRVLPLFLAGGAHVARDIPEQVTQVRKTFPSLRVDVLRPVGEDPRFTDLLLEICRESSAPEPA